MFIPVAVVEEAEQQTTLERYEERILESSPAVYWPMSDASGLPQDISGNGNHMTAVSGTPVYQQAGPFTGSLAIDYPSAAYHERAVVSTVTNNLTVEMWIRRTGNTSGDLLRHGTTSGGYELEFTSTAGAMRGNLPGVGTLAGIFSQQENLWQHFVVVRNANTWQAFVNGIYVTTSFGTATPGTPVGNTRVIGGAATSYQYSHVAFYDQVLTQVEVAAHYLIATENI